MGGEKKNKNEDLCVCLRSSPLSRVRVLEFWMLVFSLAAQRLFGPDLLVSCLSLHVSIMGGEA